MMSFLFEVKKKEGFFIKEKQFNYFVYIFNYDTKLITEKVFSQS